MKKKFLVLTLALGLLMFGATSAFADTNDTNGYGHGHAFYDSGLSAEEILEKKLESIDELLKDGKITAEEAKEYKASITERHATCDGLASNRDDHERLGIGFGDGLRDGSGHKSGRRGGFRNN